MTSPKPTQYQKGYTEFYKLKFNLTPDVLIPRPETELLVDEVLCVAKDLSLPTLHSSLTILDIGTGSGCIAISIAKNAKNAKIIATDISKDALKVAEENAKTHKVEKQIIFLQSNLLDFIHRGSNFPIDIIVTNLPYIPTARLMYIDPMVIEWEPNIALDGGKDGFELYRKLFAQMIEMQIIPKFLVAEIDYTHGEFAIQNANKYFPEANAEVKLDLAKKQRILKVSFKKIS